MKTGALIAAALLLVAMLPEAIAGVKPTSDIAALDQRRVAVDLAAHISAPVPTTPLTGELNRPFSPKGFDQPDPDEHPPLPPPQAAKAPTPEAVAGDRKTLDDITSRISPSGTIFVGGEPMLMFGKKFVRIGAHFTVTYKGADYVLELTAIDRTTFTLRLNKEEVTRPIQPGTKP